MADRHTERFLPQLGPWAEKTNITARGALYATWHLAAFPSELAAAASLKALRSSLNQLAISVVRPGLEWWVHLTRRKLTGMTPLPPCEGWFAQRFDAAYRECMSDDLYENDVWFTILLPAPHGVAGALMATFTAARRFLTLGRGGTGAVGPELQFIQEFEDLASRTEGGLRIYGPTQLGLVRAENGVWYNQIDEAFHIILNNRRRRIPVSKGRCGRNIDPYEVEYGYRDWSVNTGSESHVLGTIYSFASYPALESPVMFDALLSAPFPFTMTNSARFSRKNKTMEWLSAHAKQMMSGNDASKSQQVQLIKTQDDLQSGANVLVSHHYSLAIFSEGDLRALDRNAVLGETILTNAGINPVREDKALKPARYAQLPGNSQWRVRPKPLPSDNFASLAAMNNVPKGRFKGRWGPPLLIIRTSADTEYPFHFQVQGSAQIPKEDLGNMFVSGPAGSGKTGLLGSLSLLSVRQGARCILVDKDYGLAPMVLAAGGSYLVLPNGEPSGLSPLRGLSNNPADLGYLHKLIRILIESDGRGEISGEEDDRLARAIERQMVMPPHMRQLAGVALALGQASENGARARLRKWCRGNRLGWALDGEADLLDTSRQMIGYDTTDVVKNDEVVGPVLSYIFYRTRKLIDGTPILLSIDEMWHAAQNKMFLDDNNDQLKTIRKNEGVVLLATQSPEDVQKLPNAHTYLQQIPTKIFFSDQDASAKTLIEHFRLTTGEFEAVTTKLATMRHAFLMKRLGGSIIGRFDLSRYPEKIAVISGRRATYELAMELRKQHGEEPQLWVPHYERLAPKIVDDPQLKRKEKARVRRILLAAAALVALCPSAHAQLGGSGVIVFDPAAVAKDAMTVANTAQTVVNGYKEIQGMIHGNGFASLVPGLGSGLSANPLGALGGNASSMMSGTNIGGLGALFSQYQQQTQVYTPQGNDPEAQQLLQRAAAAAGQMAVSQQSLSGIAQRLTQLPQLLNSFDGTADIKDSMDAVARAQGEATTQSAQSAQLQALAIYQQGEVNAERVREELTARQSADELAAQAQATVDDASAGNVTFMHN